MVRIAKTWWMNARVTILQSIISRQEEEGGAILLVGSIISEVMEYGSLWI